MFITWSTMRPIVVSFAAVALLAFCSANREESQSVVSQSLDTRGYYPPPLYLCPRNEIYYDRKPHFCSANCNSFKDLRCYNKNYPVRPQGSGCDCQPGLYRLESTWTCVRAVDCARKFFRITLYLFQLFNYAYVFCTPSVLSEPLSG